MLFCWLASFLQSDTRGIVGQLPCVCTTPWVLVQLSGRNTHTNMNISRQKDSSRCSKLPLVLWRLRLKLPVVLRRLRPCAYLAVACVFTYYLAVPFTAIHQVSTAAVAVSQKPRHSTHSLVDEDPWVAFWNSSVVSGAGRATLHAMSHRQAQRRLLSNQCQQQLPSNTALQCADLQKVQQLKWSIDHMRYQLLIKASMGPAGRLHAYVDSDLSIFTCQVTLPSQHSGSARAVCSLVESRVQQLFGCARGRFAQ